MSTSYTTDGRFLDAPRGPPYIKKAEGGETRVIKTCTYNSFAGGRRTLLRLDDSDRGFSKIAGVSLPPDLTSFLHGYTPEAGTEPYVTVAMGAGEAYGANLNGDWFGEKMLRECHPTFVTHGKVFKFHRNSPRDASYGKVRFATYDEIMRRVVLLLDVQGKSLPDIRKMYVRGEPVYVSMGCAVPYDVCSICRNRAKTPREYCSHLINERLHQRPDGSMAYMINPTGRFFDISWVLVPADRTAFFLASPGFDEGQEDTVDAEFDSDQPDDRKIIGGSSTPAVPVGKEASHVKTAPQMLKAAEVSADPHVGTEWHLKMHESLKATGGTCPICGRSGEETEPASGDSAQPPSSSPSEMSYDKVATDKIGLMIKRITSNLSKPESEEVGRLVGGLRRVREEEPEIPDSECRALASAHPLQRILSTTGSMGIILKPREFQRIALRSCGMGEEADHYDRQGRVFGEEDVFSGVRELGGVPLMGLNNRDLVRDIVALLRKHFSSKSYFEGPLSERMTIVIKTGGFGDVFPDVDVNTINPMARVLAVEQGLQNPSFMGSALSAGEPTMTKAKGVMGGLGALYLGHLLETSPVMARAAGRFAGPLAPILAAVGGVAALSSLSDLMTGRNDSTYMPGPPAGYIPGTIMPAAGQFKMGAYLPALLGTHMLSAAYGANDDPAVAQYGYNPRAPRGAVGYVRDTIKNHPIISGVGAGYMMSKVPGIKTFAGKHPWLTAAGVMLPWYMSTKG